LTCSDHRKVQMRKRLIEVSKAATGLLTLPGWKKRIVRRA
jgi:hypothetical protein